jgi:outer membrane receptor protein involved in Fe transport
LRGNDPFCHQEDAMLESSPRRFAVLFVAVLISGSPAIGQTVGASLQGIVTDSSGAALPAASVVVISVATGGVWDLKTDSSGRYRVPVLQPGEYEVHVSQTGFQPVARRGVALAVGQNAIIDVKLDIGRINEELTVTGAAPVINTTSGSVSGLVTDKEIRELPLNGRSFQQLALLQTGVTPALAAGSDVVGGRTPKISINGARPEQNSFLLDGTDINNVYNKTPGSSAGVLLGVEAVLEFQVLTNAYSAEFGRSAGGIINAVTRSGTNAYHGSGFEFYRNSALDARNYFDPADKPIPDFYRHQFGGVLGGPLVKDRTFFFGAFESLIERLGVTGVTAVPDDDARLGILPARTVALHPAVPAYLETLFPRANGRSLGGGTAEYLFTKKQPTDEYFSQVRVDHRFRGGDSLFGRYTFDDGKVDRVPPSKAPIVFTQEHSRNQYLTLEHQHLFTSSLINTLKGGLNRSVSLADNVRTIDIPPALSWLPGERFGYLTITGLATEMAGDFRLPRNDYLSNWQLGDTVFWTRGTHSTKVGFQAQFLQFHQNTTSQQGGVVTFPNLAAFLQGQPSNVDFAVPGLIDPIRDYRQWLFGFFAQDDVRVRSNLSLNLGVRYEFITTPTEVNGKLSNLRNVMDPALTVGEPWHSNPSLKNLAPRIGVAWDPTNNGTMSVRGGFGLFYDQILPKYYFFSGSLNPPFTTRTTIANPAFPNVLANFNPNAGIRAQLQTVNYDLQSPYMMQYNVGVQRALWADWDVYVGYVGSRGKNLLRLGDANLAPEVVVNGVKTYQPQLGRRNPNFSAVFQRVTDAQSFYDSLQVSLMKRYSHGLRAQASYTLAKSIDDSSGINSQDYDSVVQYALDWYDAEYDRGPSAFQARHNLTFNWSWDVPAPSSLQGIAGAVLKGWQLNNVTTLQSGQPFTVRLGFNRSGNLNTTGFSLNERPDLKPGCSDNPILGGPDRYWDINCFTLPAVNTRGNLGRNTLVGPGLISSDLSLIKSIGLRSNHSVQVRLEVFNFLNRANFAVPSGRIAFTNAAGDVAPTWGRITSTVTTSRQIQLGIKYLF